MPAGTTRLRVVAADTRWAGTVAGPGWLAVGDAALAHDPLSGGGVRAALASGCEAARTVTAADAGEADALAEYQRSAEAGYRSHRAEQLRAYGQVNHWRERPFWGRRSPR